MADKRRYNSKMNAKGLENSVSEEQVGAMAHRQGSRYLFVVEAHVGSKVVDEDGSETVSLVPDLVELVPAEQEARVRDFMRALYLNRPDQIGQAAFEDAAQGPSLESAAAGIDAAVERDGDGQPTGVWDGNPDAPADPPTPPEAMCPAPDCILAEDHDGDHQPADEPGGTVVAFSGGKADG